MKRLLCAFALLFSLTLAPPAHSTESATTVVKAFYAALESSMKDGPALGFEGRYKRLEPTLTKTFDFPLMARYAVAANWSKAQPEEQKKLVDLFTAFSIATYASRFTKSNGEVFAVGAEKPTAGGTIVETTLTPKGEPPVVLNYMLRADKAGALRIVDVYLDASISELATRRAEFTSVIKREGMPALLKSLEGKVQTMRYGKQG